MATADFQLNWHSKGAKRIMLGVAIGLVALYAIVPQLLGLNVFKQAAWPKHWPDMYISLGYFLVTFIISAMAIMFLAFRRIRLLKTVLVQFASVPLNMLLPAGIGNMGVNYMYLRHQHHSAMQSGMVVSANNLLGLVGNVTILLVLFLVFGFSAPEVKLYWQYVDWIVAGLLLLIILSIVSLKLLSNHIEHVRNFKRQMIRALVNYRGRPSAFIGAYLCAVAQALLASLSFWYCLSAYGIHVAYASVFLILALSVVVRTGVPTPGGLGGVEASLVAGILATHSANLTTALASVLAFRLATYWLPLAAGMVALVLAERIKLLSPAG